MTYGYWEEHPFTYDPTNGAEHNGMHASTMHQPQFSSPPLEEVDEDAQQRPRFTLGRKIKMSQDATRVPAGGFYSTELDMVPNDVDSKTLTNAHTLHDVHELDVSLIQVIPH